MPEFKRTIFLLPFLLLSLILRSQQQDTLLLHPELLVEKDIHIPLENPNQAIKIISGSRFPVSSADLPFSTHVITREEIRRNGYETLVDALKMVPGIRVSQPGSATDGETFLMRGLLGNTYAKILINDIPVKPSIVASMPIGAQLPIKEAERIEIIYGAGAVLYGSDASAGVINIITRESDKPVFMQADLAVGGGIYSSANVMFGGRLGRDKRIFKFMAYGSNVLLERRRVFYDTSYNFLPANYADNELFVQLPNYGGTANNPILTSTPHLSRKFGFNVKYKRLTLSGETMYRRDHSALGLNPVAYSYRNPLTFQGESILRFNLNIFKEKKRWNRKTDITFLRYKLDERSSVLPVRNQLATMLLNASRAEANRRSAPDSLGIIFTELYDHHLNGLRYSYAESKEYRVEHVQNYQILPFTTLTVGANWKVVQQNPFAGYFERPVTEREIGDNGGDGEIINGKGYSTIYVTGGGFDEINGFGQLFFNGKKLKAAAGFNYTLFGYGPADQFAGHYTSFTPKASVLYEIMKNINIRTAFGTSFRPPNEFYEANSYTIFSDKTYTLYRPNVLEITPEKTISWENGIRWKTDSENVGADFTWYLNRTTNLIRYRNEGQFNEDSTVYVGQLGYTNIKDSDIRFTGGQFSIFFNALNYELDGRKLSTGMISYAWLKAKKVELSTFEAFENLQPPAGSLLQLRYTLTPGTKNAIILDLVRYKDLARTGGPKPDNKFWTWDMTWRYRFTDRFDCYLKVVNLLNKKYSGILPEAAPADLLIYNPQSGFFIRLGMNYFIE
jgi:outer membrane receptor protein involved in Fe transport